MNYFFIVIIIMVAGCGSSKNINNGSTIPPVGKNAIQVKINEERTIQFPGRASNQGEMAFTISDTSIAMVSRKHMVSTYDSSALRPGDPVLAVWVIKGLKPGTTKVKLAGGANRKNWRRQH